MVNERLSGGDQAYKARQRLNYLQMRRDNWKAIYETITENDAAATLEQIEEANQKVQYAMDERSRDKQTVAGMRMQMEELQREVAEAHSQLHMTEAQIAQVCPSHPVIGRFVSAAAERVCGSGREAPPA